MSNPKPQLRCCNLYPTRNLWICWVPPPPSIPPYIYQLIKSWYGQRKQSPHVKIIISPKKHLHKYFLRNLNNLFVPKADFINVKMINPCGLLTAGFILLIHNDDPQRMRLQRRLYKIFALFFLACMLSCSYMYVVRIFYYKKLNWGSFNSNPWIRYFQRVSGHH